MCGEAGSVKVEMAESGAITQTPAQNQIPAMTRAASRFTFHVSRRMSRAAHLLPILGGLLAFLLLAAHQLTLPGLHYDEAKEAGLNAMQLVIGQPLTAFRDATIHVGPWQLPLMVQDYIGALNVVLAVPFLAVGGPTVSALRWLPICIAALTLVITGQVARQLAGPLAAAIAVILLAVNPTFVFWSRQGIFVTNLTALLFMASLWTALRWQHTRRPAALWATAFLWGLGLYAKLLFVWAIGAQVALAIIAWAVEKRQSGQATRQQNTEEVKRQGNELAGRVARLPFHAPRMTRYILRDGLIAAGCFLLPLLPLILFNVQTGGTVISVVSNLGQSYYGVDNRAYLPNLLTRLDQLRTLLRGDHLWYLGEVYANRWAPALMALAALVSLIEAVWRLRKPTTMSLAQAGRILLPFALLALVIAQSAFTVSDLFITHYALIVPLIPLGIGIAAGRWVTGCRPADQGCMETNTADATAPRHVPGTLRDPWHVSTVVCLVGRGLLIGFILLWAGTDLANTLRYHRILSLAGGYASHSDAIYQLADFLQLRQPAAPLALDWGIDAPVRFLTVGQVNPVEVFGYERLDRPDAGFVERIRPFLDNPANLYVAHTAEFTIFQGRVAALNELTMRAGLQLQEVARFGERSGRPLFLVYRVGAAE